MFTNVSSLAAAMRAQGQNFLLNHYLGQLSVSCWAEGSPATTQLTSEIQRDKEAELLIIKLAAQCTPTDSQCALSLS
jgi:DNA-binding transcriptional regulator PaaX